MATTAKQRRRHREYMREWRKRGGEAQLAKERAWAREGRARDPEGVRKKQRERRRRWARRVKGTGIRSAYEAVRHAVRDGRLVRPEVCEDCGRPPERGWVQAHHDDYTQFLKVRWLCPICHKRLHRRIQGGVAR